MAVLQWLDFEPLLLGMIIHILRFSAMCYAHDINQNPMAQGRVVSFLWKPCVAVVVRNVFDKLSLYIITNLQGSICMGLGNLLIARENDS